MATLNIKNFPDELYEKLRELAELEHRSISQQVTHLLQKSVVPDRGISLRELRGLGAGVWDGVDAGEHVSRERNAWR